jgi:hypothetical protein
MELRRCFFVLVILAGFLLLSFALPGRAQAVSTTVVFGEVQTRGNGGASDEFIEIYNLSGSTVNIGNHKIRYRSCDGASLYTLFTFTAGEALAPYQHFLITGSGYNGTVTGNGTSSRSYGDCGQLQLQDASDNPIDTLVYTWSGGTQPTGGWTGIEGEDYDANPHNNTTGTNQDTSMVRKPDTLSQTGGHKNGQDTDNNSSDFLTTSASSPENRGSPTAIILHKFSARSNDHTLDTLVLFLFALPVLGLGISRLIQRSP